jgi:hypothetical protein
MSKVAVTLENSAPFPIPLGSFDGDAVKEYPIDSSLLFAADGRIYFSSHAIRKSFEVQGEPQRRLDSLKRRLTTMDQDDLNRTPIHHTLNQTGTEFTLADALALQFAHILRLTHDHLRRQYNGELLDEVDYRFTRPVFGPEKGSLVDRYMSGAIEAGLQIELRLGETYAGSIEARLARSLLDSLATMPPSSKCISTRGLLEPVAAGILVLSQVPNRRFLAVIMDIGAGTTDMALFAGIQPDDAPTVDRVHTYGTPISVPKAGDYIDDLLKGIIEVSAGKPLTPRDRIEIDLSIRRWKEDIFMFQETIPTLSGGRRIARITQHNFIRERAFQDMEQEMIDSLHGVLKSAESTINDYATLVGPPLYRPVEAIEIIPCGGGANLPVFGKIARSQWVSRPSGRRLKFDVQKPVPVDGNYSPEIFPQLAVALGGALRDQPVVNGPAPIRGIRGRH